MAKKRIKKSTQNMLLKGFFLLAVVVILGTVIIPFTTVASGAPAWWVDTHAFFVDVRTNIAEYAAFFGISLGVLAVLVYLFKKYIIK